MQIGKDGRYSHKNLIQGYSGETYTSTIDNTNDKVLIDSSLTDIEFTKLSMSSGYTVSNINDVATKQYVDSNSEVFNTITETNDGDNYQLLFSGSTQPLNRIDVELTDSTIPGYKQVKESSIFNDHTKLTSQNYESNIEQTDSSIDSNITYDDNNTIKNKSYSNQTVSDSQAINDIRVYKNGGYDLVYMENVIDDDLNQKHARIGVIDYNTNDESYVKVELDNINITTPTLNISGTSTYIELNNPYVPVFNSVKQSDVFNDKTTMIFLDGGTFLPINTMEKDSSPWSDKTTMTNQNVGSDIVSETYREQGSLAISEYSSCNDGNTINNKANSSKSASETQATNTSSVEKNGGVKIAMFENFLDTDTNTLYSRTYVVDNGTNDYSELKVELTGVTISTPIVNISSKLAFPTNISLNNLSEGEITYDSHDLTFKAKSKGATLSLNQEQTLPVKNNTGVSLSNGKLVRITGYDSVNNYFTVEYADNSTEETSYVDGMLTEDILPGEYGLMTYQGVVNDLNTSGGTSKNPVYLGINGNFTHIEPVFPSKVVVVGKFGKINATTGNIFVTVGSQLQSTINNLQDQIDLKAMQNPGICQMRPLFPADIVIDTNALTLKIATVKNGETITDSNPIVWYTDGSGIIKRWFSNSAITFNFTNTTGTWYFYLDNTGSAIATQIPWYDFNIIAPIFIFDWNSTLTGESRLIEEQIEFHTNSIDADTHAHFHFNDGCININSTGELIRNELTTGQPNVDGRNTCISITNTTNQDDNLTYTITNVHPSSASTYFQQDMGITTAGSLTFNNAGLFPIRTNSAGGQRSFLPATRFPFAWDITTNRPQYITSTGVRTLVTDNRYFVYYVYALQDRKPGQGMRLVSAETDFTTLALAQAHSIATLQGLYSDLRNNEIRPMYKLIFLADNSGGGSFNVAVKYTRLHQVVDIRKTVALTITSTAGITPATNVTTNVGGYGNQESLNENVMFGSLSSLTNSIPTYNDTSGKTLRDGNNVYIDGGILKVNTTVANTNTGVRLHVSNGASGAPFSGSSTVYQAVLENNGDCGLQMSAPSANIHRIMFGDQNQQINGMIRYSNTDNSMRFYNYNASVQERLSIVNTGNIGIGIVTPVPEAVNNRILHIHNSTANGSEIVLSNSTTGSLVSDGLLLQIGSGGIGYLWNRENQPLVFGTNSTERMRIAAAGNVGIGTNNPTEKLHVIGNILTNSNIQSSTITLTGLSTSNSASTQMLYINPTTGVVSKGNIPSVSSMTSSDNENSILVDNTSIKLSSGPSAFLEITDTLFNGQFNSVDSSIVLSTWGNGLDINNSNGGYASLHAGKLIFNATGESGMTLQSQQTPTMVLGGIEFSSVNPGSNPIGSAFILKAPNGNRYKVTVDNSGVLTTTLL